MIPNGLLLLHTVQLALVPDFRLQTSVSLMHRAGLVAPVLLATALARAYRLADDLHAVAQLKGLVRPAVPRMLRTPSGDRARMRLIQARIRAATQVVGPPVVFAHFMTLALPQWTTLLALLGPFVA